MKPLVVIETKLPAGLNKETFQVAAKTVLDKLGKDLAGQIYLSFVSKPESAELNTQYAGNNYATDVLSFAYAEDKQNSSKVPEVAAQIIICQPIAAEQAKLYKLSLEQEVTLLFVHGMLHVLELDHQTKAAQASFSAEQNAIMNTLGLKSRQMPWLH